ncbi:MAG: aminotransferase class V-fold PLP-dependent enzyme [Planctomycetota bacterium]
MANSPHAKHWDLDPEQAFLNHGSFGACPRPVLAAQQVWRDRLEHQPVRFFLKELDPALEHVRTVLGDFVGAHPDDLVPVANATMGVNWVLRWFPLAPGDQVLAFDHEYNATANAARAVCEHAGAEFVTVPLPFPIAGPDVAVEAIERALTSRTKLVVVDHVTSATGLVLPVERIVALARERGVETLIDGAHAPGMLPLDLDAIGAGYYTGNCHKWLCTPKGSAFLHVRRDLQERTPPLVVSHGRNADTSRRSRFRLEADFYGTVDPSPWLVIPDAIEFLGSLMDGGFEGLRRHNRDLVLGARRRFQDVLGIGEPAPASMIASLASVPLPDRHPDEPEPSHPGVDPAHDWFEERGFEVVAAPWPAPPKRLLRVSAQAYNHAGEYEALAGALATWMRERPGA